MAKIQKSKGDVYVFDVPPAVAAGAYSNASTIHHNYLEFVFDFGCRQPGKGRPALVSRIHLSPQHASQFLRLLQQQLDDYRQKYTGRDRRGGPTSPSPRG